MLEVNDFDAVRVSLASPEQVRSWSYGEVTKPETINYRTLKPERDGLFCERIFGPTKDYECACGKYRKIRYKGVVCDKCGVEIARAKVRRERMGHIELACPVSHIWFARGTPSRMGLLLDLSPRSLERVLYFSHYIIISVDDDKRRDAIKRIKDETAQAIAERQTLVDEQVAEKEKEGGQEKEIDNLRTSWGQDKLKLEEKLADNVALLRDMRQRALITENQYDDMSARFGDVFEAGIGAEAVLQILKDVNLDEVRNRLLDEVRSTSGQRRKKASKQLQLVEVLRRSGNKPEWTILTVLPVLPPDLRPMVQLDGGRFATSDLNDLYRRVINRNNRLRHLLEIGAPEVIIRNEKRMLQEAVDSLVDNEKRGRAVAATGSHKLKSLSDMLRGKQGRFRQNLLGKRVDYSGRSVIVVGPELELHQCGLPRRMALELFKPFIVRRLMEQGLAYSDKSARRLVGRSRPEVYDILEEVVKERPVLLNRAPTLHRLSIQAFEPVLIDGSAIQLHPLVCSAFNADFDGDQMAVHVPLSKAAVREAREIMLSLHNMLLPSRGEPVVTPTLDMVLGCYYLTTIEPNLPGEGKVFGSMQEARLAYELGVINLRAEIEVRDQSNNGDRIKTSAGRIIFNEILPPEMGYQNKVMGKSTLKQIVANCYHLLDHEAMGTMLDKLKWLGFHYATKSGTTISINDLKVPDAKAKILDEADNRASEIDDQYHHGLITEDERYSGVVGVWTETTDRVADAISDSMNRYGDIYMMATSGAKGNISQIRQMAGMRGLMTNPSGRIIDFPIRSSLREGHSVMEYFISTHGARKGLADTALRTSESGYLTRRLIDVAQDVIVQEEDCGTTDGIWISEPEERELLPSLAERIIGRLAASPVAHPKTKEVIVDRNEIIDETKIQEILEAGITKVHTRSPLTCQSRHGACQRCYGRDLSRGEMVKMNTAVGIIAAQSIGEPGTQLTLRTFHTGGVAGLDITSGLPRVEELFEARPPKAQAIISEIEGIAQVDESDEGKKITIVSSEEFHDEYQMPKGWQVMVTKGQRVEIGNTLAEPPKAEKEAAEEKPKKEVSAEAQQPIVARVAGEVSIKGKQIAIKYDEKDAREYTVPISTHIRVSSDDRVKAGQQLTDGSVNPQDLLHIKGKEAVQRYLVDEVQKVYRSQGVNINDKHIETIAHQMLTKVCVDSSGDTELVPGELVSRFRYEDINAKVLAEGGEPATAHIVLLGITRASLNTESWLAAASFQETTRVLTEASISGKVDRLVGLKENVIIGKLIPAQTEISQPEPPEPMLGEGEGELGLLSDEMGAGLLGMEGTMGLLADETEAPAAEAEATEESPAEEENKEDD